MNHLLLRTNRDSYTFIWHLKSEDMVYFHSFVWTLPCERRRYDSFFVFSFSAWLVGPQLSSLQGAVHSHSQDDQLNENIHKHKSSVEARKRLPIQKVVNTGIIISNLYKLSTFTLNFLHKVIGSSMMCYWQVKAAEISNYSRFWGRI